MSNRSEILSESFSAYNKTPEMVDSGLLETLKKLISHMPTPNYMSHDVLFAQAAWKIKIGQVITKFILT